MFLKILWVILMLFVPLLALECHNFAHNILNLAEISNDHIITCSNVTAELYCSKISGYRNSNSFVWKGCSNDLETLNEVYGRPECNGNPKQHYKIEDGYIDILCCDHDKCNFALPSTISVSLIILSIFTVFWHVDPLITTENVFGERPHTVTSITPEQALIHMIKVMMGTGMLSLPLAFKYSGLWLGLFLLVVICVVSTFCCRQLVYAAHYISFRRGQDRIDYANVMRGAVELGPTWIRDHGYFAKQLVNANMFIAQLGFCCVYFVFMADNLKQFFDETSFINISQARWIAMLLIPILGLCTIRHLKVLAPLALIANFVYIMAIAIVMTYLFTHIQPTYTVTAVGTWTDLPLFFGTVIFAFEGIAVILPIENQMDSPQHFISPNGVLNTACLLVLAAYCTMGFYGYLAFGEDVKDTVTLNLPNEGFYQAIKIMFVGCILVSYPLQFYVPMERVEKWISRKIPENRQNFTVYTIRYSMVIFTCLMAELIPHLALFISLVGAFAGTALALLFPPIIELLCYYAQKRLSAKIWIRNIILMMFGLLGFTTGTYASVRQIILVFGKEDI